MEGQPASDGAGIGQQAAEHNQPAQDAVMENASLKRSAPDDVVDAGQPEAKQPRLEEVAAEGCACAAWPHCIAAILFWRDPPQSLCISRRPTPMATLKQCLCMRVLLAAAAFCATEPG
jgi:hypothetical protein